MPNVHASEELAPSQSDTPSPAKAGKRRPTTPKSRTRTSARAHKTKPGKPPASTSDAGQVAAWEDDPMSGTSPMTDATPDPGATALKLVIAGPKPPPKIYARGTPEFRYWAAADAAARGAKFWNSLRGDLRWHELDVLKITLDAGPDFNAYYDRAGLWFFHGSVAGTTVYSGESPDVLCHEMGHAILDALRPDLWDVMSGEVAAFHESFGDMAAILVALQLPPVRQMLAGSGTKVYHSSRLSRLAEQLGWAIRQLQPDAVPSDCLRNAVNSFFYHPINTLPPSSPDTQLSSEPHSFSRVFTGAFFEAYSNMVERNGGVSDSNLENTSQDLAALLVKGVSTASVVPDFYSQVAASILEADAGAGSKYHDALKSAFVRRGILSLSTAYTSSASLEAPPIPPPPPPARRKSKRTGAAAAFMADDQRASLLSVSGIDFGVGPAPLVVQTAWQEKRFAVAPAMPSGAAPANFSQEQAARDFMAFLFRRGRVDFNKYGEPNSRVLHPYVRKTHELVATDGSLAVVRRNFDCGLG